ncbi:hypothetical protein BC829DRAFT_489179 [Chytridium lagenaria]|nr:hypothetical protein BC829DRAFT_489179 [Chytridium lagenaria]
MSAPLHATVLRLLLILLHTTFSIYVIYNVTTSFQKEPISIGFTKLLQSPWAITALFDYIASIPLGATFIALHTSESPLLALLTGGITAGLGNPVVGMGAALMGLVAMNLVVYVGVIGRAFLLEEPGEGWRRIRGEPWNWTTFVDSFEGVLFAISYVVVREWGRVGVCVFFVVGLLVGGNGFGCIYVLLATIGASNIREAILSTKPIPFFGSNHHEYQTISG